MRRPRHAIIAVAAALAASPWLVTGGGVAVAQSIPDPGRYQCAGASGVMADLGFTVGPGNVLFHVAPPQASYQARYNPGPPPQVMLLTVTDGKSAETGIVCQMR
jgi:hypothetical protein